MKKESVTSNLKGPAHVDALDLGRNDFGLKEFFLIYVINFANVILPSIGELKKL